MSRRTEILIRGEEAARAKRIDLIQPLVRSEYTSVGPWADELNEEYETARQAGFEQGRNEGRAIAVKQMEGQFQLETERHEADLAEVSKALVTLLADLEAKADELEHRLASETVDLALEIAEAVLGHEVAASADPGADALARCLELAPSSGDLVARLHPEDAAQLGEVDGLNDRGVTIHPDPSLARGDAVVMIDDATIDARMSESLRRVGEALR